MPDGLILYAQGPLDESSHKLLLHTDCNMEKQLEQVCFVDNIQLIIHIASGYNRPHFLDVLFTGANSLAAKRAAINATNNFYVIVECMYQQVRLY